MRKILLTLQILFYVLLNYSRFLPFISLLYYLLILIVLFVSFIKQILLLTNLSGFDIKIESVYDGTRQERTYNTYYVCVLKMYTIHVMKIEKE